MRKKSILLIILLAMLFLISCNKKNENSVQTQENSAAATTAPTQVPTDDADTAQTGSQEAAAAVTPTEAPSATEPVVIDGYDITASVSGTPLKDAYADYFKIGVGINGSSPENASTRSAAMSEIIKYHFNSVTYSNLMKPSYLLDQQGSIRNFADGKDEPALKFDSVKEGLEFCKENKIQMRGHVLVWHNQVPDWFFREGYQNNGEYVDKDTMLTRLESYIRQVLTYTQTEYPGVIYCWDVVNEAVENSTGAYETESGFQIRSYYDGSKENLWYKVIGVEYVEKAFEYARKYAAPGVKLFYNDYNTFQPSKTILIYNLASYLKDKGLIDGIGMQGYMDLTYPGIAGGQDSFLTALSKFTELGLEIQLTELTIRSDDKDPASMEKQAKRYESLFQILKGMDTASGRNANITSVTVFGLMDEYLFYTNDKTYARLFDGKLQPKPAFYSILGVAEKK